VRPFLKHYQNSCFCSGKLLCAAPNAPGYYPDAFISKDADPMATPVPLQSMSPLPAKGPRTKTRVAIAGLGASGLAVARRLARGDVPTAQLVAVATRDQARGRAALDALDCDASIVGLDQLAEV